MTFMGRDMTLLQESQQMGHLIRSDFGKKTSFIHFTYTVYLFYFHSGYQRPLTQHSKASGSVSSFFVTRPCLQNE